MRESGGGNPSPARLAWGRGLMWAALAGTALIHLGCLEPLSGLAWNPLPLGWGAALALPGLLWPAGGLLAFGLRANRGGSPRARKPPLRLRLLLLLLLLYALARLPAYLGTRGRTLVAGGHGFTLVMRLGPGLFRSRALSRSGAAAWSAGRGLFLTAAALVAQTLTLMASYYTERGGGQARQEGGGPSPATGERPRGALREE